MSHITPSFQISVQSPNLTAELFLEQKYRTPIRTLHCTEDKVFWVYTGNHYKVFEEMKLKSEIERFVRFECYMLKKKKGTDEYITEEGGGAKQFPFPIDPVSIGNIFKQLMIQCNEGVVKHPHQGPSWLFTSEGKPKAENVKAFENCLINLEEWVSSGDPHKSIMPHDPTFFSASYIGCSIDPNDCLHPTDVDRQYYPRKKPTKLIETLKQGLDEASMDLVHEDGSEFDDEGEFSSVNLLREFGGYLMTNDKSYEKGLWIEGPPRSGKGTFCGFLQGFFGREIGADGNDIECRDISFCGMDVSAFTGTFGLQDLLGMSVLFLNDPQLEDHHGEVWKLVERLKIIISKDPVNISRKNKTSLPSVNLPLKVIVNANFSPDIEDSTASFATRFLYIKYRVSFLGREDSSLLGKLFSERKVALWWFLTGYRNLCKRGYFQQPISSLANIEEMRERNNPVYSFVKEMCVVERGKYIYKYALCNSYNTWAEENGFAHLNEKHFSRNLLKVLPTQINTFRKQGSKRQWEGISVEGRP